MEKSESPSPLRLSDMSQSFPSDTFHKPLKKISALDVTIHSAIILIYCVWITAPEPISWMRLNVISPDFEARQIVREEHQTWARRRRGTWAPAEIFIFFISFERAFLLSELFRLSGVLLSGLSCGDSVHHHGFTVGASERCCSVFLIPC